MKSLPGPTRDQGARNKVNNAQTAGSFHHSVFSNQGKRLFYWLRFGIVVWAQCFFSTRGSAADHVDYRFEFYQENADRMEIITHSVLFETQLIEALSLNGELVYDGISGATPTGAGHNTTQIEDIRRALNVGAGLHIGPHTISPGFAYSKESDYESTGISINDAIDLNDKNTTLRLGVAHDFDRVLDFPAGSAPRHWRNKDNTQLLVGLSQILDPKTIATIDFTYGQEHGFLNDPYRLITFDIFGFAFAENRPDDRKKKVLQLGLTHQFEAANGSAELSYRFHNDSFGVNSHTAALAWHQKLGSHLILSPLFRYYQQTKADFYRLTVHNTEPNGFFGEKPKYYSADYRLSELRSLTYGIQASVIIKEWLYLDLGYHRYEMAGLDDATWKGAYPKANIYTIGLRAWF